MVSNKLNRSKCQLCGERNVLVVVVVVGWVRANNIARVLKFSNIKNIEPTAAVVVVSCRLSLLLLVVGLFQSSILLWLANYKTS